MKEENSDLHGNAPDNAPVALILIDVINDLEFEGGDSLLRYALPAARKIAALKDRCQRAGIPQFTSMIILESSDQISRSWFRTA